MKAVHFVVSGMRGAIWGVDHPKNHAWVDRRFELYRRFTFASLKGQSEQDFYPVLLLNRRYKYAEKVFSALEPEGLVIRSWRDGQPGFADGWMLEQAAKADVVYYSRVDTDDLLCRLYVEFVRSICTTTPLAVMTFNQGYCYWVERGRVGNWGWHGTPFYTVRAPSKMFIEDHSTLIGTHRTIGDHISGKGGVVWGFPCRGESVSDVIPKNHGVTNMFCVGIHDQNTSSGFSGHHGDFIAHVGRLRDWYPAVYDDAIAKHGALVRDLKGTAKTERYGYVNGELRLLGVTGK